MAYRLGIIGFGSLAEERMLTAIAKIPDLFQLRAVLARSPQRQEVARAKVPGVFATGDEKAFFEQELDAVYIATPNNAHIPYVEKSLGKKWGVLVEKPFAAEFSEAVKFQKGFNPKKSPPLMMAYMSKNNRYNCLAKKLLDAGEIGDLLSMSASFEFELKDLTTWRMLRSASGSGALGDVGVYPITTALDFFGEVPISATAVGYPVNDPQWAERICFGKIDFSHGRFLQVSCSFLHSRGVCEYKLLGTKGVIVVQGSWGQHGNGEIQIINDKDGWRDLSAESVDPYVEELKILAASLSGAPVPYEFSLQHGIEDMAVLNAMSQSAALNGKTVSIQAV